VGAVWVPSSDAFIAAAHMASVTRRTKRTREGRESKPVQSVRVTIQILRYTNPSCLGFEYS
jgi:hypothetical protein